MRAMPARHCGLYGHNRVWFHTWFILFLRVLLSTLLPYVIPMVRLGRNGRPPVLASDYSSLDVFSITMRLGSPGLTCKKPYLIDGKFGFRPDSRLACTYVDAEGGEAHGGVFYLAVFLMCKFEKYSVPLHKQ